MHSSRVKADIIYCGTGQSAWGICIRVSGRYSLRCRALYSHSILFHPATPEGKLFLRLRAGLGDATGRSIFQRSSYIAYESRGVCDVATRANGFDEVVLKGELDCEDAADVQSMILAVAVVEGGCLV